jgi:hypothetical protein
VPHTSTFFSAQAARSIERFAMPVVINSFSLGSASITARGNAVRSRIITTTSKSFTSRMVSSLVRRTGALNTLNSTSGTLE